MEHYPDERELADIFIQDLVDEVLKGDIGGVVQVDAQDKDQEQNQLKEQEEEQEEYTEEEIQDFLGDVMLGCTIKGVQASRMTQADYLEVVEEVFEGGESETRHELSTQEDISAISTLDDSPLDPPQSKSPLLDIGSSVSPPLDTNPSISPPLDTNPSFTPPLDTNPSFTPSLDSNPSINSPRDINNSLHNNSPSSPPLIRTPSMEANRVSAIQSSVDLYLEKHLEDDEVDGFVMIEDAPVWESSAPPLVLDETYTPLTVLDGVALSLSFPLHTFTPFPLPTCSPTFRVLLQKYLHSQVHFQRQHLIKYQQDLQDQFNLVWALSTQDITQNKQVKKPFGLHSLVALSKRQSLDVMDTVSCTESFLMAQFQADKCRGYELGLSTRHTLLKTLSTFALDRAICKFKIDQFLGSITLPIDCGYIHAVLQVLMEVLDAHSHSKETQVQLQAWVVQTGGFLFATSLCEEERRRNRVFLMGLLSGSFSPWCMSLVHFSDPFSLGSGSVEDVCNGLQVLLTAKAVEREDRVLVRVLDHFPSGSRLFDTDASNVPGALCTLDLIKQVAHAHALKGQFISRLGEIVVDIVHSCGFLHPPFDLVLLRALNIILLHLPKRFLKDLPFHLLSINLSRSVFLSLLMCSPGEELTGDADVDTMLQSSLNQDSLTDLSYLGWDLSSGRISLPHLRHLSLATMYLSVLSRDWIEAISHARVLFLQGVRSNEDSYLRIQALCILSSHFKGHLANACVRELMFVYAEVEALREFVLEGLHDLMEQMPSLVSVILHVLHHNMPIFRSLPSLVLLFRQLPLSDYTPTYLDIGLFRAWLSGSAAQQHMYLPLAQVCLHHLCWTKVPPSLHRQTAIAIALAIKTAFLPSLQPAQNTAKKALTWWRARTNFSQLETFCWTTLMLLSVEEEAQEVDAQDEVLLTLAWEENKHPMIGFVHVLCTGVGCIEVMNLLHKKKLFQPLVYLAQRRLGAGLMYDQKNVWLEDVLRMGKGKDMVTWQLEHAHKKGRGLAKVYKFWLMHVRKVDKWASSPLVLLFVDMVLDLQQLDMVDPCLSVVLEHDYAEVLLPINPSSKWGLDSSSSKWLPTRNPFSNVEQYPWRLAYELLLVRTRKELPQWAILGTILDTYQADMTTIEMLSNVGSIMGLHTQEEDHYHHVDEFIIWTWASHLVAMPLSHPLLLLYFQALLSLHFSQDKSGTMFGHLVWVHKPEVLQGLVLKAHEASSLYHGKAAEATAKGLASAAPLLHSAKCMYHTSLWLVSAGKGEKVDTLNEFLQGLLHEPIFGFAQEVLVIDRTSLWVDWGLNVGEETRFHPSFESTKQLHGVHTRRDRTPQLRVLHTTLSLPSLTGFDYLRDTNEGGMAGDGLIRGENVLTGDVSHDIRILEEAAQVFHGCCARLDQCQQEEISLLSRLYASEVVSLTSQVHIHNQDVSFTFSHTASILQTEVDTRIKAIQTKAKEEGEALRRFFDTNVHLCARFYQLEKGMEGMDVLEMKQWTKDMLSAETAVIRRCEATKKVFWELCQHACGLSAKYDEELTVLMLQRCLEDASRVEYLAPVLFPHGLDMDTSLEMLALVWHSAKSLPSGPFLQLLHRFDFPLMTSQVHHAQDVLLVCVDLLRRFGWDVDVGYKHLYVMVGEEQDSSVKKEARVGPDKQVLDLCRSVIQEILTTHLNALVVPCVVAVMGGKVGVLERVSTRPAPPRVFDDLISALKKNHVSPDQAQSAVWKVGPLFDDMSEVDLVSVWGAFELVRR